MSIVWDGLKLLALTAIVYGLLAVFVLKEDYLAAQFQIERVQQHQLLGDKVADAAEARASNLFTRLVVANGTLHDSLQDMTPAVAPPAPTPSVAGSGGSLQPLPAPQASGDDATSAEPIQPVPSATTASSAIASTSSTTRQPTWLSDRMRVLWTIAFFTLVRISYALVWWPFLVLSMLPALVDAIATRKVSATTFALTSPQLQGFVMRALPLMLVGYFLWIVLPFHEHPMTVPIGIAFTTAMIWLGVVEFAKRG